MALIVVAGINMMIFEFVTVRGVKEWNLDPMPPRAARLAGGISITCWILVLVMGRLIVFTLEHFSITLGVPRVCEISFAFFFGNTFEKKGDCSPKFLNCARLHFA
jgi:hypothetical protein